MKIYLENRLLVQSRVFETRNESEKPKRNNSDSERDWNIYLWGSKNKLSAEEDNTSCGNNNTIEARLEEYKSYKNDEFRSYKITPPNHCISISGYSSFIKTPKKTMMKLVNKLEKENIDCLLNDNGAPVIPRAEYISPRLKKKLKNPIEIKL